MSSVLKLDATFALEQTRSFLICDECFWCASGLINELDIESCPQCERPISCTPIAKNEGYTFNYTHSRGVEVEFTSNH